MKKIISIALFFVCSVYAARANVESDSLARILTNSKARISMLTGLALEFMKTDSERALLYVQEALNISKNTDYLQGQAKANHTFGRIYSYQKQYDNAIIHYLRANDNFLILNEPQDQMSCNASLAYVYHELGNVNEAIDYYNKALEFSKITNDSSATVEYLNSLAHMNIDLKEFAIAKKYFLEVINAMSSASDTAGLIRATNNLGITEQELGKTGQSLKHFTNALRLAKNTNNINEIAHSYNNIANFHYRNNNPDACLKAYFNSLEILKNSGNYQYISIVLNNIGMFHIEREDYNKGINYLLQSLEIAKSNNLKGEIALCYINLADTYSSIRAFEKAYKFHTLYSGIKDSLTTGDFEHKLETVDEKYQVEKKDKEIQILTKDKEVRTDEMKKQNFLIYSLIGGVFMILVLLIVLFNRNQQRKKINNQLEAQKEEIQEKSDKLIEINKIHEKLSIVARETDNSVIITDSLGDIEWVNQGFTRLFGYTLEEFTHLCGNNITLVSGNPSINEVLIECIDEQKSVTYSAINETKSGEKIWVQTTLTPIMKKNTVVRLVAIDSDITVIKEAENEIKTKSKLLEKKNLQITQSLSYAKLIQDAILPSKKYIEKFLPESFVFYRPRDIVSGDFYWFSAIKNTDQNKHEEKIFIAVADCTGHGVPGALMSMIGSTLLNDSINSRHIYTPSKILEKLNKGVVDIMTNREGDGKNTDGMEISICVIDKNKKQITIASANQPVYIIENNNLHVVEGDIKSIGGMFSLTDNVTYTDTVFNYSDEAYVYMCSDGFGDQFGGDSGKKFMTSRLRRMIVDNHKLPMHEQQSFFTETFENWKGNNRQIDDILVIGYKL